MVGGDGVDGSEGVGWDVVSFRFQSFHRRSERFAELKIFFFRRFVAPCLAEVVPMKGECEKRGRGRGEESKV